MDRVRLFAEVVGITALVVSLLFVGFELKQTRDMNLAQLHANRLSLSHERFLAYMESEPMLSVWAKQFSTDWKAPHLTEIGKAAAEISAMAVLSDFDLQYQFIEQGFDTTGLESLKLTMRFNIDRAPEIEEVFRHWWDVPGDTTYGFTHLMNEVLADRSR